MHSSAWWSAKNVIHQAAFLRGFTKKWNVTSNKLVHEFQISTVKIESQVWSNYMSCWNFPVGNEWMFFSRRLSWLFIFPSRIPLSLCLARLKLEFRPYEIFPPTIIAFLWFYTRYSISVLCVYWWIVCLLFNKSAALSLAQYWHW